MPSCALCPSARSHALNASRCFSIVRVCRRPLVVHFVVARRLSPLLGMQMTASSFYAVLMAMLVVTVAPWPLSERTVRHIEKSVASKLPAGVNLSATHGGSRRGLFKGGEDGVDDLDLDCGTVQLCRAFRCDILPGDNGEEVYFYNLLDERPAATISIGGDDATFNDFSGKADCKVHMRSHHTPAA